MINRIIYSALTVLALMILSGCVIKIHTFYDYSTHLPGYTISEFDTIDRTKYEEYFLNDFYLTVNVTSSDYYPSEKRSGAPYYLWFYGVSKNHRYEKMKIKNCNAISSKKGKVEFDWLPIEYDFEKESKVGTDVFYYSPQKHDSHEIDLDIEENEILKMSFDLEIIDSNGESYKKSMCYEIKPDIKRRYFETVIDRM